MMLLFDDRLYIVDSEPELKRQYADFTLIARPDMRKYEMLDHLMEFKFVKLNDVNLNGKEVQHLSEKELQELPQVQAAFTAAFAQLETYKPILFDRYGKTYCACKRRPWWRLDLNGWCGGKQVFWE
jgi:hypothetical protein